MIDRTYQREMLQMLEQCYPLPYPASILIGVTLPENESRYAANMAYLEAHGLVDACIQISADHHFGFSDPTITAKGIDFLADDGGLSAILGVVTIKLHEDTIRKLVEQRIFGSDLPEPQKAGLISQLRALPSSAIELLAKRLIEKGMESASGAAFEWLQSAFHSLIHGT